MLDLMIARIPRLPVKAKMNLIMEFDFEADIAACSKEELSEIAERRLTVWDPEALSLQAEADFTACLQAGMGWVSWAEDEYPPLLREMSDPPPVLFYRGRLPDPERPLAAVVGTRRPSSGAALEAFELARGLGRAGVAVVSGLALGIDSFAHRGNLEGGAPTVAVLGSAVDRVYPASNRALAARILENGGALLSEYPPGTRPVKWNFPARNRIIAGLARAVVVVEAPEKSGALITAGFALDYGRELYVSSAGAGVAAGAGAASPLGAGTRKLAEDGAAVISGAEGLLRDWGLETRGETEDTISGTGPGPALAASLARALDITL
jgi:DNA processing protein